VVASPQGEAIESHEERAAKKKPDRFVGFDHS
jgi:hypothetical protein